MPTKIYNEINNFVIKAKKLGFLTVNFEKNCCKY